MPVLDIEVLQAIAILAGITALLGLGLAIWAATLVRRRPSVVHERHEGTTQEVQTLREKYSLMEERLDRHERTFQNLRDDLGQLRSEVAPRSERIAELEKAVREQQEQIFELREEEKVLMQREDRLERQHQELQNEWNNRRHGARS